ncbi:efflux transporter outer membrane subunit [Aurantiacibacter xanthus]|uniref:Efflux transporter outer membrane subunit n=1 Tax=Aurantiacibacter xanthus TaxID=1784712 RepID=A0A3A1P2K7_9SPHN|nr:efflux transporter outer membrane subunit [Aurantiacibacter xanthus]RIV82346.1 efflux transporter outer membrane subunit [Aurantiacibacter xanthus]
MIRRACIVWPALLLAGCSMNPQLEMPVAPVAAAYPLANAMDEAHAADLGWREMFGDPRLQRLIARALSDSRDLRIAVLNVEAARAQFRVQRGAMLPAVEVAGSYSRQRTSAAAEAEAGRGSEFDQFTAQAALTSFEIDLFGRSRSLSQAAFERYLATDEGRRATQIALIGAVADAYLAERLADEQLKLTEATLSDWRQSLDIARRMHAAGQNSGVDVAQAEGQVRQAEADLEARRRVLAQSTNALALLIGGPLPEDLPPPLSLAEQGIRTQLPAGLPSDLLVRRPDIREAEHQLVAANADVGAARAAFFPRLSLTAAFGFASGALDSLFNASSRAWSFTPQVAAPIFQGGQLRGNLDLAEVRKSVAVANYERAIQSAFREVADGLAGRATFERQLDAQRQAVATTARRVMLSDLRYRAGVFGRLELLDAQRDDYAARSALLDLERENLSNAIGLYRALGGGLLEYGAQD